MGNCVYFLALAGSGVICSGAPGDGSSRFEVASGAVSFKVATNVPGVEVQGKSNILTAYVLASPAPEGMGLQEVEAWAPVRGFSTGMKVRDEHMKKYVFTTPDGQVPDIVFSAETGSCKPAGDIRNLTCDVPGVLRIRGSSHPVTLKFAAKQENGTPRAFRITLDTTVKLTDFNIEAPSQLGVKTSNDVKVHLDFTAKEAPGGLTTASK